MNGYVEEETWWTAEEAVAWLAFDNRQVPSLPSVPDLDDIKGVRDWLVAKYEQDEKICLCLNFLTSALDDGRVRVRGYLLPEGQGVEGQLPSGPREELSSWKDGYKCSLERFSTLGLVLGFKHPIGDVLKQFWVGLELKSSDIIRISDKRRQPGRPSPRNEIEKKFKQRVSGGENRSSISEEARDLCLWAAENLGHRRIEPRSIERYQALKDYYRPAAGKVATRGGAASPGGTH